MVTEEENPGQKHGVRVILAQEDVEELGWGAFAILDRALRRHGPWPRGELGYWELAWARQLNPAQPYSGDWLASFRCWPTCVR